MAEVIRPAIYWRVSTDDQETSPENQIEICRQYISSMEWPDPLVFGDEGVSGRTMDRPGWEKLIEAVKAGKVNLIVAKSLSRLARTEKFLTVYDEILQPVGCEFATMQERFDTSSAMGRFAIGMMLLANKLFAEQTRDAIAATQQLKAQQGHWTRGQTPFGMQVGSKPGIPEADPERWPWLVKMFELRAAGVDKADILQELANKDVRTVRGAELTHQTLGHILRNPVYKGLVIYRGEVVCDADGKPIKGLWECQIDPMLWERAQDVKKARRGRRPESAPFLLNGKVYTSQYRITSPQSRAGEPLRLCCYHAQGRADENGAERSYDYYMLETHRRKRGGIKAEPVDETAKYWTSPRLRADELDNLIVEFLSKLSDKDTTGELKARIDNIAEQDLRELRGQLLQLKHQLRANTKKWNDLKRRVIDCEAECYEKNAAAMNEGLTLCESRHIELEARIEGIQAAVDRLEMASTETTEALQMVNVVQELRDQNDVEGLRQIIDMLVQGVEIIATENEYIVKPHLWALPAVRKAVGAFIPNAGTLGPAGFEPATK